MNSKSPSPLPILLTASVLLFAGCASEQTPSTDPVSGGSSSGKLRVSCTSNIVKDLVTQIGGQHIDVTAIMDGPGVDPHLYTPSPQDINVLTESDVVVYSGLHLEAQLEPSLDSLANRGVAIIKVTEILEKKHSDQLLEADGAVDPHVWFDLDLWAECGHWVAAELGKVDEAHASDYVAQAEKFQTLLEETKAKAQAALDGVPEDRRILVTAHDAFQYFARTFQFRVEAVQGLSTESEPGLKRINELATLLIEARIGAIFTEQSVSDRNIQALISECTAQGHTLVVGGKLYSDTAGPAGTPEETLAGAVLHDIREIARGLGVATAPQESP